MESPVTNHAIKLYTEFGHHVAESKHNPRLLNHEFTLFLEDVLVNDTELAAMSYYDRVTVVGCLLLFNANSNYACRATDPEDGFYPVSVLIAQFGSRKTTDPDDEIKLKHYQELVQAYAATKYVWDGTRLYQWNGNVWVHCHDHSINPLPFQRECWTSWSPYIHSYSLTDAIVREAAAAMLQHLRALQLTVREWCTTPSALVELVKANPCIMNRKPHKITIFDGALNLQTCAIEKADPYDYSTIMLPYTPVPVSGSGKVSQLFANFKCELPTIQDTIQACLQGTNQLIFIGGMPGGGCTALWTLLKNACGPYADATVEGHRATFLGPDDLSILEDEARMSQHRTIVFDCEAPPHIEAEYGGRPVLRVILEDTIDPEACVVDVEVSYSTRLKLTHVLGYLLLPELVQNNPLAPFENLLGADIMNAIEEDEGELDFTGIGMDFLSRAFGMMGVAPAPAREAGGSKVKYEEVE